MATDTPATPPAGPSVSEWVWRFLALAMVFALGWMAWVIYLLNPPPLVTSAAFEASAKARASGKKPIASGTIGSADGTASAQVEGLASGQVEGAIKPAGMPQSDASTVAVTGKPGAEKPAAVAYKATPADVLEALEGWARAWSAKDADAYLAAYAKDFKVPNGEARDTWEKTRRARITAPKNIVVTVDKPKIEIHSDEKATVTFSQTYKSDIVVSAAVPKTLVLVRADGRWLIQQENSGN